MSLRLISREEFTRRLFATLCSKLTNTAKQAHSSMKQTDPIRSEDSDYVPSDQSPISESEDETDSLQQLSTEQTPIARERSETETQITYEASDLDESDSEEEEIQPIPEQFLPQSALIFKPSASYERKLLAEILPAAIRKATDYDVMRAGWKKSGLYPLDEKSPIEWLPSGGKCPERKTNMPLISGRDLTSSDVMTNIEKWVEDRNLKSQSKEEKGIHVQTDPKAKPEETPAITAAAEQPGTALSELDASGSDEAEVIHSTENEELLGIEIESDAEDLTHLKRYAEQEQQYYLLDAYESELPTLI